MLSVGAVVGLLWVISTVTARRYESRSSSGSPPVPGRWRLSEPGFWKGSLLVRRQRAIHAAAALAAAALLVARPASHPVWAQRTALIFAAAVLAVAIIVIASPLSDRHKVTVVSGGPDNNAPIGWWCWVLLAAAAIAIVGGGGGKRLDQPSH